MPRIRQEPEALDEFDEWAGWLRSAYSKPKRGLPRRTAAGAFRVRCYRYYRRLREAKLCDELLEHVADRDPGKWKHPTTDLGWVLRLAENDDQPLLTASTRMRMIAELKFAEDFNIPASRLLGFLHEAGGYEHISRFGENSGPDFLKRYADSRQSGSRRGG